MQPRKAAESTAELIEPLPGGRVDYRPDLRYLLIDESRYTGLVLPSSENLASALFRLENVLPPEELQGMVKAQAQWLYAPDQALLRRAFTIWSKCIVTGSIARYRDAGTGQPSGNGETTASQNL